MRAIQLQAGEEVVCTVRDLQAQGIHHETVDLGAVATLIQRVQAERGWSEVLDVRRSIQKSHDEIEIIKEADEHCHLEHEARIFLEGEGLYDIRCQDDQWLRIWVQAGDFIVIPPKRYHRFLTNHSVILHYVQPHASRADLVQLYRVSEDETRAG